MLRSSGNVQPVSSYGPRVGGRVELHVHQHVDERPVRLIHAQDVVAGRDLHAAGGERRVRRVHLDALPAEQVDESAASTLRRWPAGITHACGASFLPRSTARLFFSQ